MLPRMRWLLVVLACACGGDPAQREPAEIRAAACPLVGAYRIRVGEPREYMMWWHFEVGRAANGTPTIALASPVSSVTDARVTLLDDAACKIVITGKDNLTPFELTATVDRATHAVTGVSETRGDGFAWPAKQVQGVVDATPPAMPASCFVAGIYELDTSASWTCDPPARSFGMYSPFAVFALRVEPLFDSVAIYRVEPKPPYEPLGGDEVVVRDGCSVTLKLTHGRRMDAKLTFHGDAFDGLVRHMEYGGADSGGGWQCTVDGAAFTGKRIR
jgi:hypothetical protein